MIRENAWEKYSIHRIGVPICRFIGPGPLLSEVYQDWSQSIAREDNNFGLVLELQLPRFLLEYWDRKGFTATADISEIKDLDIFTRRIGVIHLTGYPKHPRGTNWGKVNYEPTWYSLEQFRIFFPTKNLSLHR